MENVIRVLSAAAIVMAAQGTVSAASITNQDADSQTLQITENGVRMEIVVAAGETVAACEAGCFLVAPNGDRSVLQGGESVTIQGGAVIVE